jgi:hypothetical protein
VRLVRSLSLVSLFVSLYALVLAWLAHVAAEQAQGARPAQPAAPAPAAAEPPHADVMFTCPSCGPVSVPVVLPRGMTVRDVALRDGLLDAITAYGETHHDVDRHFDRIGAL